MRRFQGWPSRVLGGSAAGVVVVAVVAMAGPALAVTGSAVTGSAVTGRLAGPLEARGVPSPAATALDAVSCLRTDWCIGAGEGLAGHPYSALWNGSSWQALDTPTANDAVRLFGVSCASQSSCVAIGASPSEIQDPVTELWNGHQWRLTTPGDQFLPLGISCPAASLCVAVGHSLDPDQNSVRRAVAMTWDGTAWHTVTLPVIPGAVGSSLSSVSCTTASLCTAVGYYRDAKGGPALTLAEQWNGSDWQLQSIPNAPVDPSSNSPFGDFLTSISCAVDGACVAVGETETFDGAAQDLGEAWDGMSWTLLPQPDPNPNDDTKLTGVSCQADGCVAVGAPASYSWDGSSWKDLSSPSEVLFTAVACLSFTACVAVGSGVIDGQPSFNRALSGRWDGSSWHLRLVGIIAELAGVSCTSRIGCLAVGGYLDRQGDPQALTEQRSGSGWRRLPTPSSSEDDFLTNLSCTGSGFCMAIQGFAALTTHGTRWRRHAFPDAGNSDGLSCTSQDNCISVGVETAARWDGRTWHQLAINSPLTTLNDVSCRSRSWCMAVGISDSNLPFADFWNGHRWRATTLPHTRNVDDLMGISCPSRGQCLAVGTQITDRGAGQATAELWNGKTWRPLTLRSRGLTDVSCSEVGKCLAVGGHTSEQVTRSVVALWDGRTWHSATLPGPGGLDSVSCLRPDDCVAVGQATSIALAEHWNGKRWQRLVPVNP